MTAPVDNDQNCDIGLMTTDRPGTLIVSEAWGDGHGNVFVERLWRSVKYEEVYLKAYERVGGAHIDRPLSRRSTTVAGRKRRPEGCKALNPEVP